MQHNICTLGLSGGVDSSVAALLLKEHYDVHPVFMRNWQDDSCPWQEDYQRATAVASQLGLNLEWVDGSALYYELVFKRFIIDLQLGYTPNPDIWCNEFVKFDILRSAASDSLIATGHYARILAVDNHYGLYRAIDTNKDQSYFLSRIDPSLLPRILFPLGTLTKPQVRDIARAHNLTTATHKESMGICFIGPNNYRDFLRDHVVTRQGPIVDDTGKSIGEHKGLLYYTLGQRQGLGIGGLRGYNESPWYVIEKKLDTHTLVVSQNPQHPSLMHTACTIAEAHWFGDIPDPQSPLYVQTRHRQKAIPCTVTPYDATHYSIHCAYAPWALTPGQHAVLYDHNNDRVVGSGIIHTLL